VRIFSGGGEIQIPAALVASVEVLPDPPSAAPQPENPLPAPGRAAPAPVQRDARKLIDEAAAKHGLPAAFLHSVAQAESAYQIHALSPKGAIGVMQLMPATAASLGVDPHDPAQNIDAGARHLADLLVQYNGSSAKALAAYNAGAGAVARYGGVPPYPETRNYVQTIINNFRRSSPPNSAK